MDHSNHVRLNPNELVPAILEGAAIYDSEDNKVGTVSHMHGSQVVVDVGGFLGLGAKPVALETHQLDFMRDADGTVHGVTPWSKDELKELPLHTD